MTALDIGACATLVMNLLKTKQTALVSTIVIFCWNINIYEVNMHIKDLRFKLYVYDC